MIVGVDFDNTIVCYDAIFHRVAVERGLIPAGVPATKTAVRDHLRRVGQEPAWTELQGYVYGPRLVDADMYPGVKDFFLACRQLCVTVKIISHKTRHPYSGEAHDLHAFARGWLAHHGFLAQDGIALPATEVFLEVTKEAKLARIKAEKCTVFIDDLPEILGDREFPDETRRVLFDALGIHPDDPALVRVRSWAEINRLLLGSIRLPAGEAEVAASAGALLAGMGMRLAAPPVRVPGGGNNRVFEARSDQGDRYLLKHYFSQPGDLRNRFEAERLFYRHTARAAPGMTPRAIGWDEGAQLALLEFVVGQKLAPGEVGSVEMKAALGFFSALNFDRDSAEAGVLPMAAEACFSLVEHCQTVDQRVSRLRNITLVSPIDRDASTFVTQALAPTWDRILAVVRARGPEEPVARNERCISPSDFGFHNCLRRPDGSFVFLDFEYSGWDDPAKTMCDFFCQPAVPAPEDAFDSFVRAAGEALKLADVEAFLARTRLLLPIYRLKWCAIMLNEFVRADHGRRAFALGRDVAEERKVTQLAAARRVLATLAHPPYGTTA
ncbi:MAG: hypothetical protein RLZZ129_2250 [Verrucomicrobiota bacterium]|jgi:hypothetical protein